MEFIINVMSKVFPDFQMQWLVDETKKNITKELDFLQEGKNAEKVSELFRNYTWLKVPKIYWEYSSERVLVMEYVTGGQVNDVKYLEVSHYIMFWRFLWSYIHILVLNSLMWPLIYLNFLLTWDIIIFLNTIIQ